VALIQAGLPRTTTKDKFEAHCEKCKRREKKKGYVGEWPPT